VLRGVLLSVFQQVSFSIRLNVQPWFYSIKRKWLLTKYNHSFILRLYSLWSVVMNPTIKTAIKIVGSQKALGEARAVSAAVYKWLHNKASVSPEQVTASKATGGEIQATKFALICRRCSRHRPTITMPPNGGPNNERESNAFTCVSTR
jgi:hypothetical protein